jgi:hypothetical protein
MLSTFIVHLFVAEKIHMHFMLVTQQVLLHVSPDLPYGLVWEILLDFTVVFAARELDDSEEALVILRAPIPLD